MQNPFKFGMVVEEDYFTDREKETTKIKNEINNLQHMVIYSQRRVGKTSLILNVLKKLNKKRYETLYIDISRIYSVKKFIEIYSKNLYQNTSIFKKIKINDFINRFLGILHPTVSFDENGNVSFNFNFQGIKQTESLEQILELPEKLFTKKKIVIVFDEFQEITNLKEPNFEKIFRSIMQHQKNICYIFIGSQTHLLQKMFTNESRALYKSAKLYNLKKIPQDIMIEFILSRFKKHNIKIDRKICHKICELSENIPYHIQQLAQEIWYICYEKKMVREQDIDDALSELLINQEEFFIQQWRSCSQTQCALLEAIARSGGEKIYSEDYKRNNNLTTGSTISKNIKILINKTFLFEEQNEYFFQNPIFKLWIKEIT